MTDCGYEAKQGKKQGTVHKACKQGIDWQGTEMPGSDAVPESGYRQKKMDIEGKPSIGQIAFLRPHSRNPQKGYFRKFSGRTLFSIWV